MEKNGWILNVDYSNGQDWDKTHAQNCSNDTFYGYKEGSFVGNASITFEGSGKGILSYGNCYNTGYVVVFINGIELGRSYSNSRDLITFQYLGGETLSIKEVGTGIIKLYSLDLQENGE